jgi:hypothetical protein
MKKVITIMFLFVFYASYSQITLQESDYPFPLSIDIPMYYQELPKYDLPKAGEDQIWQVPYAPWAIKYTYSYYEGNSNQFPSATRYSINSNAFSLLTIQSHNYTQKLSDGIYYSGSVVQPESFDLGIYTGIFGDTLIFQESYNIFDNSKNLVFPLNINSKWEQSLVYKTDFILTVSFASVNKAQSYHKQYVNYRHEVDGWGQMRMPISKEENLTFDVLQVKSFVERIDSFFVDDEPASHMLLSAFNLYQGNLSSSLIYRYYAKGFTEPLVTVTVDPKINSVISIEYIDIALLNLRDQAERVNTPKLFPNPVPDDQFSIISDIDKAYLNIYNNQGNLIQQNELQIGQNNIKLAPNVSNGIYYYVIREDNGKTYKSGKFSLIR